MGATTPEDNDMKQLEDLAAGLSTSLMPLEQPKLLTIVVRSQKIVIQATAHGWLVFPCGDHPLPSTALM